MLSFAALQPRERQRRAAALALHHRETSNSAGPFILPDTEPAVFSKESDPEPCVTSVSSLNLPPAGAIPPAALLGAGIVSVVSYQFARRWAVEAGLCHRRNALYLAAANAERKKLGLLPFALLGDGA